MKIDENNYLTESKKMLEYQLEWLKVSYFYLLPTFGLVKNRIGKQYTTCTAPVTKAEIFKVL